MRSYVLILFIKMETGESSGIMYVFMYLKNKEQERRKIRRWPVMCIGSRFHDSVQSLKRIRTYPCKYVYTNSYNQFYVQGTKYSEKY